MMTILRTPSIRLVLLGSLTIMYAGTPAYAVAALTQTNSTEQQSTPPASDADQVTKEMRWRKLADGNILITSGFPYRDKEVLDKEYRVVVKGSKSEYIYDLEEGSRIPILLVNSFDKATGQATGVNNALTTGEEYFIIPPFLRPSSISPLIEDEPPLRYIELSDAVGVVWIFKVHPLVFTVRGVTFVTQHIGAVLRFTAEGVMLEGFELR